MFRYNKIVPYSKYKPLIPKRSIIDGNNFNNTFYDITNQALKYKKEGTDTVIKYGLDEGFQVMKAIKDRAIRENIDVKAQVGFNIGVVSVSITSDIKNR